MENLKTSEEFEIHDSQRLLESYNHHFTSSHILLAGWCSVTLLFFILAFNKQVNININVVKIICICFSIIIVMLAYRSIVILKIKEKRLIILTKDKKEKTHIKRAVKISYMLSILFLIISIVIFLSFVLGLSKNPKL